MLRRRNGVQVPPENERKGRIGKINEKETAGIPEGIVQIQNSNTATRNVNSTLFQRPFPVATSILNRSSSSVTSMESKKKKVKPNEVTEDKENVEPDEELVCPSMGKPGRNDINVCNDKPSTLIMTKEIKSSISQDGPVSLAMSKLPLVETYV